MYEFKLPHPWGWQGLSSNVKRWRDVPSRAFGEPESEMRQQRSWYASKRKRARVPSLELLKARPFFISE
jgi:hypothetical protein